MPTEPPRPTRTKEDAEICADLVRAKVGRDRRRQRVRAVYGVIVAAVIVAFIGRGLVRSGLEFFDSLKRVDPRLAFLSGALIVALYAIVFWPRRDRT